MTKALSSLKQMIFEYPLAGISTRVKLYPLAFSNVTSANATIPVTQYVNIDQYEYFWCTGIYASYLQHTGPSNNSSPLISIRDIKSGNSIFKYTPNNVNTNYINIEGNIPPGELQDPYPTNGYEPYLPGLTEIDYVFEPQAQIRVNILHPGAPVNAQYIDIVFFGYSVRIIRDV